MKLILLHDSKNDDGIRLFLHETWESYVKVRLLLPVPLVCPDILPPLVPLDPTQPFSRNQLSHPESLVRR
jgi:hypothetical protein